MEATGFYVTLVFTDLLGDISLTLIFDLQNDQQKAEHANSYGICR
jgi:hypothetical protein